MPNHSIIPRTIKEFNLYIVQTCAYLILGTPTNAVRFNWTAANLTAWQAFLSQWNPLYLLYSNKKGGYTTDIKIQLQAIIANAVIYARNNRLIELVKATISLNPQDCSTFNLPANMVIAPTGGVHPLAKTKEMDKTIITLEGVYPRIMPELNGLLHIKVYSEKTQSGRAHKLKSFDLIEYAIGVFYLGTANLPTHATDTRLTTAHSSKANFILSTVAMTTNLTAVAAGATEPARIAILFFRWAKSKHPTLDGPWNGPFTTPLL